MLLFDRSRSVSVAAYSLFLSLFFRKSWKPMTSATIMAMAMKKCANLPARIGQKLHESQQDSSRYDDGPDGAHGRLSTGHE